MPRDKVQWATSASGQGAFGWPGWSATSNAGNTWGHLSVELFPAVAAALSTNPFYLLCSEVSGLYRACGPGQREFLPTNPTREKGAPTATLKDEIEPLGNCSTPPHPSNFFPK